VGVAVSNNKLAITPQRGILWTLVKEKEKWLLRQYETTWKLQLLINRAVSRTANGEQYNTKKDDMEVATAHG
jgi:hypothetical protein